MLINEFHVYLNEIVGFFIIESIVMNTTQNFRHRGSVDTLWEMSINHVNQVITDKLQQ